MQGKTKKIWQIAITLSLIGLIILLSYYEIYKRAGFEWIIIVFLFLCVALLLAKIDRLKSIIKKQEKRLYEK